ncbi:hypothetical protein C8J56DRAFT_901159 [Mycena floridula]|nr:hypothetical protein C8J56DRAFT_901159 [Mycena floridula]
MTEKRSKKGKVSNTQTNEEKTETQKATEAPGVTKKKNLKAVGKQGNKGDFKGEELAFLEKWFEKYSLIDGRKKTFWTDFFKAWWVAHPWLPLSKTVKEGRTMEKGPEPVSSSNGPEPGESSTIPEASTSSTAAAMTPLTAEEEKSKLAFMEKLKRWFSNRKTKENRVSKNPFAEWLSHLSKDNQKPHPKDEHKFYMSMPKHSGKIGAAYEERFGEPEPAEETDDEEEREVDEEEVAAKAQEQRRLALTRRVVLAAELYQSEPDTVKKDVKDKRDIEFKEKEEKHKKFLKIMSNEDFEGELVEIELQDECRENIAAVAQPLLNALHRFTSP